jgi:DHA2 family multidrug resistance protein
LWVVTYREAQVQAFADAYLVIALCFAISIAVVPLLRKVPRAR